MTVFFNAMTLMALVMFICGYVTLNYVGIMIKKGEEFNSLFLLLVSTAGILVITFLGIPGALLIKSVKKLKEYTLRSVRVSA